MKSLRRRSVSLGDGYTEAVCVEYDPGMVSYEALLSVFWSEHDASAPVTKAQYASVIWPTTDEQRRLAEAQVTAYGDSVVTVIGERPTDGAPGRSPVVNHRSQGSTGTALVP